MDTFNFSFFDDKPEAPGEKPTGVPEENADISFSPAPHSSPADADPFGFDEFTPHENFSASETGSTEPESSLDLSLSPASGNSESNVNEDDDGFPDLDLVRSVSQAMSPDLEFPDFDSGEIDPETLFASSNLDFNAPVAEGEFAPSDDLDFAPLASTEAEPEPAEIRASVEPMVFISPSPAAPIEAEVPLPPASVETAAPVETEIPVETVAPVEEVAPVEVAEDQLVSASPRKEAAKPVRFLTADDPYGEVAPPRERLRVAILGASGIGKNHARWFARHSCDVVSFLGSSDESVDLTRAHLEAHMGFSGRGFSDLSRLLNETKPQAVCVASPSPMHYAQAMQCLEAGVHVLCEKPLVYSPARTNRENMDGARELLKAAARRNLVLATQLQYGAATPILCRLAGVSPFEVGDFVMEIETTNLKAPRDPRELWIELAPHTLSVAQFLAGEGAQVVEGSVQMLASRAAHVTEIASRFGITCEGGRLMICRSIVRWFDKIVDNREPRRRFAFNGRVVQYSGVKSPDGTYIAQYVAPDGYISHYSDPVDYLIGNFVRTCWDEDELLLSAEQGVQNLDWLLLTADKL